jgi:hypothetical protein
MPIFNIGGGSHRGEQRREAALMRYQVKGDMSYFNEVP